jgi:hypothetical protein
MKAGWKIWGTCGVLAFSIGIGCGGGKEQPPDSCLKGVFDCFPASGECLLANAQGEVTVTWGSGAKAVGTVGMAAFDAFNTDGQTCFHLGHDGEVAVVSAGGKDYRITRLADKSTTVTCPDGSNEAHPAGESPSSLPGVDPAVFISCKVAGMCTSQAECEAGQVCCQNQCLTAPRCPGTCDVDADCGTGNRCCDKLCTSLPACDVFCIVDVNCADGNYCNGQETCSASKCRVGTPVSCDDQVACTLDECSEELQRCDHTPDDARCGQDQRCDAVQGCVQVVHCTTVAECNDQDACSTDACTAGICVHQPVSGCCNQDADCSDGKLCNGAERCSNHTCAPGTAETCDDGIACTTDSCIAADDACRHVGDDAKCSGGQVCNAHQGCVDQEDCVDDSYEPNDIWAQAVDLTDMDHQKPIQLMSCPANQDWFMFSDTMGDNVAVMVVWKPEDGVIDLSLFDSAKKPVGVKQSYAEGTIMIMVSSPAGPADYTLSVENKGSLPVGYSLMVVLKI